MEKLLEALKNARNEAETVSETEIADRCALYIARIRRGEKKAAKEAAKSRDIFEDASKTATEAPPAVEPLIAPDEEKVDGSDKRRRRG